MLERIALLKHMLKICPVAMLQDSTNEIQSKLKPFAREHLREIYRLRDKQERFKNKEIGRQSAKSPAYFSQLKSLDGDSRIHVENLPMMDYGRERSARITMKECRQGPTPEILRLKVQECLKTDLQQEDPPEAQALPQGVSRRRGRQSETSAPEVTEARLPSSNERQDRDIKIEDREACQPTSSSQVRPLQLPSYYYPVDSNIGGGRQEQPLNYLLIDPAQLTSSLPGPTGQQPTTQPSHFYLGDYHSRQSGQPELPHDRRLLPEPTWTETGGSPAQTNTTDSGNGIVERMPLFNEGYVFENTSMDDPYQGSIYNEVPGPSAPLQQGHYDTSHYGQPYRM